MPLARRTSRASSFVLALLALLAGSALATALACGPGPEDCHEACYGNARKVCSTFRTNGFSEEERAEECGPTRRCVEGERSNGYYAACAIGGRDARCNADVDRDFCDGNVIARCRGAYVTDRSEDCAARGLFCASDGDRVACVQSLTVEPRCEALSREERWRTFCDGDRLAKCFGVLLNRTPPCAELPDSGGPRCEDSPGGASCGP